MLNWTQFNVNQLQKFTILVFILLYKDLVLVSSQFNRWFLYWYSCFFSPKVHYSDGLQHFILIVWIVNTVLILVWFFTAVKNNFQGKKKCNLFPTLNKMIYMSYPLESPLWDGANGHPCSILLWKMYSKKAVGKIWHLTEGFESL